MPWTLVVAKIKHIPQVRSAQKILLESALPLNPTLISQFLALLQSYQQHQAQGKFYAPQDVDARALLPLAQMLGLDIRPLSGLYPKNMEEKTRYWLAQGIDLVILDGRNPKGLSQLTDIASINSLMVFPAGG